MKDDPIVSEVRRVRESLWQEAGCALPRLGPSLENAEALRRYADQQAHAAPALREQPPPYGEDQKQ